jgi:uncharacterized protein YkwD
MLSARKRPFAARISTILVAGIALAAVPATASADVVPPVPLPGLSGASPSVLSPTALASCRGAGARRASTTAMRRAMLCLVNHARASAGLSPFRAERHLGRAAARHASDMGRRNFFAHVSPSGKSPLARARAVGWRGGVGEVIAWGCGTLSSPGATLHAWLNSPPHRAIVLGGGHAAGVGVKRLGGCGGRAYWVMDVG